MKASRLLGLGNYYTVVCNCGQAYSVHRDEAGERRRCGCGQSVTIPKILQTTSELIRSMVASGRLPSNDHCPVSGEVADKTVVLNVLRALPRDNFIFHLLAGTALGAFFGIPGTQLMMGEAPDNFTGGNVLADVPIRVSESACTTLMKASQKQLNSIVRTVPLYAHLLDEYPRGSVRIAPNPSTTQSW